MADTFAVRTQYPTVEFVGGSQTRQVMTVGYVTKPHGVYVEVRIPKAIYSAEEVRNEGIGYSGMIEDLFNLPGVTDMTWTQRQRQDGTLVDEMVVYVTSSSGESAAELTVPFDQLTRPGLGPPVARLRKQLDEAEAS